MVSAEVRVEGDLLVVEPKGMLSKIAALRSVLEIPLSCVRNASTARAELRGLRMAGTALPPHYAGHFYDFKEGKIFYVLSNRDRCVTITLAGFTHSKVVIEGDDKERAAEMIRNAAHI